MIEDDQLFIQAEDCIRQWGRSQGIGDVDKGQVFFYNNVTLNDNPHKENLEKITEALDNNTRIINELKQSLDNVLK